MKRREVLKMGLLTMGAMSAGIPGISSGSAVYSGLDGYPASMSVSQGETLDFHLSHAGGPTALGVNVFRKGLSESTVLHSGVGQVDFEYTPGNAYEIGCGWPVRYTLTVPLSWPSGVYCARFTAGTSQTEILFVVRPALPASTSKILFQLSLATYQAYNNWPADAGGKSLYNFNSSGGVKSTKVSFARPFTFAPYSYELWFVRLMEKLQIPAEFCTSLDLHANPQLLDGYQLFLSVGHDEYWSKEMRDNVEAFVADGGNAAFFGGNTCWFQVRFDSPSTPGQMICHKDDSDPIIATDPSLATTNWFVPNRANRPENSLTGLSYRSPGGATRPLPASASTAPAIDFVVRNPSSWVFQGTGLGQGAAFGSQDLIVGYETDAAAYVSQNGVPTKVTGLDGTPHSFEILATADATSWVGTGRLPGWAFLGMFQNNGTVFNTGTTGWSRGMVGFVQNGAPPNEVCKITENVLRRLGSPKTAAQRATVAIYQYHTVQANGDGWRYRFHPSPFINDGSQYDGAAFRAYRSPQPGTVPIYQYYTPQANGDGVRFMLSTDANAGIGWTLDGVPFYAFPAAVNDATNGPSMPVYWYSAFQANGDGVRYLYSLDPNIGIGSGWIFGGIAFHAFAV